MTTKKSKTIEDEINSFTEIWGVDEMISFIEDTAELIQIYNIEDEKEICNEDKITIRVIRTVYHVSYLAEKFAGTMAMVKARHPRLYERLEKFTHTEQDSGKG